MFAVLSLFQGEYQTAHGIRDQKDNFIGEGKYGNGKEQYLKEKCFFRNGTKHKNLRHGKRQQCVPQLVLQKSAFFEGRLCRSQGPLRFFTL